MQHNKRIKQRDTKQLAMFVPRDFSQLFLSPLCGRYMPRGVCE